MEQYTYRSSESLSDRIVEGFDQAYQNLFKRRIVRNDNAREKELEDKQVGDEAKSEKKETEKILLFEGRLTDSISIKVTYDAEDCVVVVSLSNGVSELIYVDEQ